MVHSSQGCNLLALSITLLTCRQRLLRGTVGCPAKCKGVGLHRAVAHVGQGELLRPVGTTMLAHGATLQVHLQRGTKDDPQLRPETRFDNVLRRKAEEGVNVRLLTAEVTRKTQCSDAMLQVYIILWKELSPAHWVNNFRSVSIHGDAALERQCSQAHGATARK